MEAQLRQPPKVGEKAPPLLLVTGKGPDGKPTHFDLRQAVRDGPVVVAFFPGTFTSTCTEEMGCFTREWSEYANLGAQFIGVSVDSVPSQRAYAKQYGFTVPFGSDFEGRAIRDWGVASKFWWGTVARRATFIVDRSGKIRYADVLPNSDIEPNYADIKAALAALE
jgi:glutaredoxin-dependent peroxiredoxin